MHRYPIYAQHIKSNDQLPVFRPNSPDYIETKMFFIIISQIFMQKKVA